jgi:hypothetical protein
MKRSIAMCAALIAVCAAVSLAAEPGARPAVESPYLRPEMARLMEAVTFHASFDADSMNPDMAEGPAYAPTLFGTWDNRIRTPQFADGLFGRALVLGTGGAVYPRAGNLLLEKRGSLAIWIRPENWQRPRDDNCVFMMTSNSSFYLERQGPDQDKDGRLLRQEGVFYLVFVPGKPSATLDGGSNWANGQWHLLVANWSWPTIELGVDGGPFQIGSLSAVPPEGLFGGLVLGDRSGRPHGLLDEFLAFRRPLTREETQLLYHVGTAAASRPAFKRKGGS